MIVYLDTNAYISANYQFNNGKLKALKNLINAGKIVLLYSSAIVGEIYKNAEDGVVEEVNKYNRILNKDLKILKNEEKYNLSKIDVQDAVLNIKTDIENFFNLKGTKKIPLNPLDAEKLMEDYFCAKAPFESKKSYEFKDAIMINSLKYYQKNINEPIYIVSNDKGFKRAFEGNINFKVFDFLSGLLNHYYVEETQKIMKCISVKVENGMFDDNIREYLESQEVFLGYYAQYECEEKKINKILSEIVYIEEENGINYATISSNVDIELDIIYRDENTSYYDREIDGYLFENYIHIIEKHNLNVETRWKVKLKNKNTTEFEIDKFEIDEDRWRILEVTEETMNDYEIIIEE